MTVDAYFARARVPGEADARERSMSAGSGRLEGADYGLLIDRKRPLSFTFDGTPAQRL